jgi:hypothetical protein
MRFPPASWDDWQSSSARREGPCRRPTRRQQTSRKCRRGRWGWMLCTPASRQGSLGPSRADESWPICAGCSATWAARTAGSWPSMPGSAVQMGCSGCWPPPTGTRSWSAMTCAAMWWSTWATRAQCWWWTRPGSSRRGPPRWACNASTRVRPARSTTASSACSWPTPAQRGGRSLTGSCTCPAPGPTIRAGAAPPGSLSRSGFGPSRSWPGSCWSAPWMLGCRLRG